MYTLFHFLSSKYPFNISIRLLSCYSKSEHCVWNHDLACHVIVTSLHEFRKWDNGVINYSKFYKSLPFAAKQLDQVPIRFVETTWQLYAALSHHNNLIFRLDQSWNVLTWKKKNEIAPPVQLWKGCALFWLFRLALSGSDWSCMSAKMAITLCFYGHNCVLI